MPLDAHAYELELLATQLARLPFLCASVRRTLLAEAAGLPAHEVASVRGPLTLLEPPAALLELEGSVQVAAAFDGAANGDPNELQPEGSFLQLALQSIHQPPVYLFALANEFALPHAGAPRRAAALMFAAALLEREPAASETFANEWLRLRGPTAPERTDPLGEVYARLETTSLVYLTGNLIEAERVGLARALLEAATGLNREARADLARLSERIEPEEFLRLELVRLLAITLRGADDEGALALLEAGIGGLPRGPERAEEQVRRLAVLPRARPGSAYVLHLGQALLRAERSGDAAALVAAWAGTCGTDFNNHTQFGAALESWLSGEELPDELTALWADALTLSDRLRDRAVLRALLAAAQHESAALVGRHLFDLPCVVWGLKAAVAEKAPAQLSRPQLDAYLRDRVELVRREIASIDAPEFVSLCREMGACQSVPEALRLLVPGEELDESQWLTAVMKTQDQPYRSLFAAANFFITAVQLPEVHLLIAFIHLAQALNRVGRHRRALAVLEPAFGFEPADFADSLRLAGRLNDWHAAHEDSFAVRNICVKGICTLGDALRGSGRADDGGAVLEALAGIRPVERDRPAALVERLVVFGHSDNIGGDNFVRHVRALAEAHLDAGRPASALRVLEASRRLFAPVEAETLVGSLLEWAEEFSAWMLRDLALVWQRAAQEAGRPELVPALERAALLADLRERLSALPCLSGVTTGLVRALLVTRPPEALRRYLRDALPPVERLGACTDSRFREVATALSAAEDWEDVRQLLDIPDDAHPADWWTPAVNNQGDAGRVLVCLANHLALVAATEVPVPDDMRLRSAGLLANALAELDEDQFALDSLTAALGLDAERPGDPARFAEWHAAVGSGIEPDLLTSLLNTLAACLCTLGRAAEGADLLNAHVGLTDDSGAGFARWRAVRSERVIGPALRGMNRAHILGRRFADALRVLRLVAAPELLDRVDRLGSLCVPTRAMLLSALHFWTRPGDETLTRRVGAIEEFVVPVADEAVRRQWEEWAAAPTIGAVRERLGLSDTDSGDDINWLKLAAHCQTDPPRLLFCVANHLAWPDARDRDPFALELLANTLRLGGRHALAVAALLWPWGASESELRDRAACRALAERVREGVGGFAPYYLTRLGESLGPLGRAEEAVLVLEGLFGLAPEAYRTAEGLAAALGAARARDPQRPFLHALAALTDLLVVTGTARTAVRVLASGTDSATGNDLDADRFLDGLRRARAELGEETARTLLSTATGCLRHTGRPADALTLWLGLGGLDRSRLADPGAWAGWVHRWSEGDLVNDAHSRALNLVEVLLASGEHEPALTLIRTLAGISVDDLDSPAALGERIRAWVGQMTPHNAGVAILVASSAVAAARTEAAGVRLVEAWLAIEPGSYADRATLAGTLPPPVARVPPRARQQLLRSLAQNLNHLDRAADAEGLVGWLLDVPAPTDPGFAAALPRTREEFGPPDHLALVGLLADALRKQNRNPEALLVLAAELAVRPDELSDPDRLAAVLRARGSSRTTGRCSATACGRR